jgi:hypothetical protein
MANTPWQNPTVNFNFDTDVAGQGNSFWLPEIYSKKAQIAFRKTAVVQSITNTDYMGEISAYGDTVNIIKEPQITVSQYLRGQTGLTGTDLTDEELQLVIDQANYFQFEIDDLEKRFSHMNWQDLAANNAGYQIADHMDAEIIDYMLDNVSTATPDHLMGGDGAGTADDNFAGADPMAVYAGGSGRGDDTGTSPIDPLTVMSRAWRMLDEENVPAMDRWFLAGPDWYEELAQVDSKLLSADYNAGVGSLRNGLVQESPVRGFTMYVTNNMPTPTNAGGAFLAGHRSAVATAEQLQQVETLRSTDTFRDIVRGLHVYGRKVLRPESLIGGYYTITPTAAA